MNTILDFDEIGEPIRFRAHGGVNARLLGGMVSEDGEAGSLSYQPENAPGAGSHFKRAAGRYAGTAAGLAAGAATGYAPAAAIGLIGGSLVDSIRHGRNFRKAVTDRAPLDILHTQKFVQDRKPEEKRMSAILEQINLAIKINPANKGKFTNTKEKSGKSTEELAHSKNKLTKKRAVFAENAKHWHHGGKKEMSARETLASIINLKAIDLGRSYPDYPCGAYPDSGKESKKDYPSLYISDRDDELNLPLEGEARVKYKLRSKEMRQDHEGKKRHSASIEIHSIDPIKETTKPKGGAKRINIQPTEPMRRFSRREQLGAIINFARGDRLMAEFGKLDAITTAVIKKDIRGFKKAINPKVREQLAKDMPPSRKVFRAGLGNWSTRAGFMQDSRNQIAKQLRSMRNLSVREQLENILMFGDTRPRNPLGEFSGGEEEGPSANAVAAVYKRPMINSAARDIAIGGAGSVAGAAAFEGGKHLLQKIKKVRA